MPALLTRISMGPNVSAASVTRSATSAELPTSQRTYFTCAPAPAMRFASAGPLAPSMSERTGLPPSRTKRSTMARPMPRAAPVTMAVLSLRFMSPVPCCHPARHLNRRGGKARARGQRVGRATAEPSAERSNTTMLASDAAKNSSGIAAAAPRPKWAAIVPAASAPSGRTP